MASAPAVAAAESSADKNDAADAKAAAKTDAAVPIDAVKGAKAGDAAADGAASDPAAIADDKKEVPAFKKAEAKDQLRQGLCALTLESNSTVAKTAIDAAVGSSVKSGTAAQTTIAGVNLMLRAKVSADGIKRTQIPIPGWLHASTKVLAGMPDGKPLPSWMSFDAATGALTGTPPTDLVGNLSIVVNVPMPDGSTYKGGVLFGN